MAQAINNIIGKKFGRLTVIEYTDKRVSRAVVWKCKCECGNITYMTHKCLKGSVSCGCYQKENCSKVGLIYNSTGRKAYKNTVKCKCYDCENIERVKTEMLGKRCEKCDGRLIPI